MVQTLAESLGRQRAQPVLMVVLTTAFLAGSIMVAAKLIWRVPTQLLLVAGIILFFALAGFWIARRGKRRGLTMAAGFRQAAVLLTIWIVGTGIFLGVVFRLDRGGWLWFQVSGYDTVLAEEYSEEVDKPLAQFLEEHPIFSAESQDDGRLILKRGVYDIAETIVVPRGVTLTIEPGTVLRFHVGRSLISYSPIIARGTTDAPIHFKARNNGLKWGVVGIVEAGPSVFEYVRFEHGRQALINKIDFFGALSLINSEAEIAFSEFVDLFGKDGVYVRDGRVRITENRFEDVYKDGLDLDGGTGEISRNQFINSGDEGIDLGDNFDVQVFDNQVLDSRGGRISADVNLEAIIDANTLGYSEHD
jgi:hypothetical protein